MVKKAKTKIKCKECGRSFYVTDWEIRDGRKYCCYKCYWKSLKGIAPKIDNSGNPAWNKGKKFNGGKGYGNWQGGKTPELMKARNSEEYTAWRQQVFKRDSYTCQMCGTKKSGVFNSHHIIPFNNFKKWRYRVDNGILVCKKCHKKINHKKLMKFCEKNRALIDGSAWLSTTLS